MTFAWQGSPQPDIGVQGTIQPVLTADQIQRRVLDIARQINTDYAGKTLYAVGVLEDGFIFMSDLVRHLEIPVVCQFVKPETHEIHRADANTTEIFFSPEVEVKGGDVLLIQGLLQIGRHYGVPDAELIGSWRLIGEGCTLLDRQTGRSVMLQPDYFGFLVDERYVFGYGLGTPKMGRNLPYVATTKEAAGRSTNKVTRRNRLLIPSFASAQGESFAVQVGLQSMWLNLLRRIRFSGHLNWYRRTPVVYLDGCAKVLGAIGEFNG